VYSIFEFVDKVASSVIVKLSGIIVAFPMIVPDSTSQPDAPTTTTQLSTMPSLEEYSMFHPQTPLPLVCVKQLNSGSEKHVDRSGHQMYASSHAAFAVGSRVTSPVVGRTSTVAEGVDVVLAVGLADGTAVGASVGANVGDMVGENVGETVGLRVGDAVGALVGVFVGMDDGKG
jgi:hypothetical protein